MLKKINKNIYLDEMEINILRKFDINIDNVNSYDEVLLLIDNIANDTECTDEELDELDYVASSIGERKYYTQVNK